MKATEESFPVCTSVDYSNESQGNGKIKSLNRDIVVAEFPV